MSNLEGLGQSERAELPRRGADGKVVGVTREWDLDWLYLQVSLLPDTVIADLAVGPRYGWDCTVCRVLRSSPDNDSPWGRLTRWHQELVDASSFGFDEPRQDPGRCGVIYGIAKAIAEGWS